MRDNISRQAALGEELISTGGNMMENKRVCGNCRWHACEIYPDFICANEESEYAGDYTGYGDSCEEWEEKLSADRWGGTR